MGRVLVTGSINVDLTATAQRHPGRGETVLAGGLLRSCGGKGGNQAVAAARLGADVTLIGALGEDPFGDEAERFLAAEPMQLRLVRVSSPTGVALIVVADHDNTIVAFPGANALLEPSHVAGADPAPGDVLVSQLEIPLHTVEAFFRRGREAGARTVLNAAPAAPIPPALAELVSVLVVNESEAAFLLGERVASDPRAALAAARHLRRREDAVVITLGPRGAVAIADEREIVVPAPAVAVVDPTGAGDCFVGALATMLAQGRDVEVAIEFAVAAASVSVQRPGAAASMPARDDVEFRP